MKPINENTFAIPVPMDAENFWINSIGCIRYSTMNGRLSSVLNSDEYFEKDEYTILGTITKTECSFDCSEITNEWKSCNCGECFDFVKEKIEATTGYLFENPVSHPIEIEPTSRNHYEAVKSRWQQHQDRVIEKLLIIKKK